MPQIAISNTSLPQYLHQAGHLDLLRMLFGHIVVPQAVAAEIARGRALGLDLPELSSLPWVRLEQDAGGLLATGLEDLGAGEAEVISLAKATPGALAILDDLRAREIADALGVPKCGTAGVLIRAKRLGILPRVASVLDVLVQKGYWLSARDREIVLRAAGEHP
jgi:predicted nucleic acid-binding protein